MSSGYLARKRTHAASNTTARVKVPQAGMQKYPLITARHSPHPPPPPAQCWMSASPRSLGTSLQQTNNIERGGWGGRRVPHQVPKEYSAEDGVFRVPSRNAPLPALYSQGKNKKTVILRRKLCGINRQAVSIFKIFNNFTPI